MAPVKLTSSVLDMADYDPLAKRLDLTFKSQKTYSYAEVPLEVYQALVLAESAGKYYGANIRGKYQAPTEEGS
jgi:lysyl-tRNA synthetase class 2